MGLSHLSWNATPSGGQAGPGYSGTAMFGSGGSGSSSLSNASRQQIGGYTSGRIAFPARPQQLTPAQMSPEEIMMYGRSGDPYAVNPGNAQSSFVSGYADPVARAKSARMGWSGSGFPGGSGYYSGLVGGMPGGGGGGYSSGGGGGYGIGESNNLWVIKGTSGSFPSGRIMGGAMISYGALGPIGYDTQSPYYMDNVGTVNAMADLMGEDAWAARDVSRSLLLSGAALRGGVGRNQLLGDYQAGGQNNRLTDEQAMLNYLRIGQAFGADPSTATLYGNDPRLGVNIQGGSLINDPQKPKPTFQGTSRSLSDMQGFQPTKRADGYDTVLQKLDNVRSGYTGEGQYIGTIPEMSVEEKQRRLASVPIELRAVAQQQQEQSDPYADYLRRVRREVEQRRLPASGPSI